MKYLLLSSCLLLTSCASIKFATIDHGQIVDEHDRTLNILGRPRMTCRDTTGQVVADGYFIEQTEDGAFIIDEYGVDYVKVINPKCELNSNE
jgi:hypothetical protein